MEEILITYLQKRILSFHSHLLQLDLMVCLFQFTCLMGNTYCLLTCFQLSIIIMWCLWGLISIFICFFSDISQSRSEGPMQPHIRAFSNTQMGSRNRCFKDSWYKENTWLEYSVRKDLCYPCRHFSVPNTPQSVFTSTGFSNWKIDLCKEKGFKAHFTSEHHKNAWKQHQLVVN